MGIRLSACPGGIFLCNEPGLQVQYTLLPQVSALHEWIGHGFGIPEIPHEKTLKLFCMSISGESGVIRGNRNRGFTTGRYGKRIARDHPVIEFADLPSQVD